MKKLLKALKKTEFNIYIDSNSDSVYYKKRRGVYEFCFVVNYSRGYSDVVLESRDMPEEFTLKVNSIDITDLEIYKSNENIELTDEQQEKCLNIIFKNIITE